MRFFGKTTINFMGKRKLWYTVSASVILLGILSVAVKGLHFGIDFLGGTELIVEFSHPPDIGKIRSVLDNAGFQKAEIKGYGLPTRVLIRTEAQGEGTSIGERIKASIGQSFPE